MALYSSTLPLPCPFCGSKPLAWEKSGVYFIGCKEKRCPCKPKHGTTAGHQLAISSWNRRAADAPSGDAKSIGSAPMEPFPEAVEGDF